MHGFPKYSTRNTIKDSLYRKFDSMIIAYTTSVQRCCPVGSHVGEMIEITHGKEALQSLFM